MCSSCRSHVPGCGPEPLSSLRGGSWQGAAEEFQSQFQGRVGDGGTQGRVVQEGVHAHDVRVQVDQGSGPANHVTSDAGECVQVDLRIAAGAGGPAAPGPRAGPRLGRTIQALTHRVPGARTGRGCGGEFWGDHQGPRGADGPSWLSTTGWRPGQFLKRGQKVTMRWLDASGIAWSRCLGLAADDFGVTRIMFCRVRGVRVRLRRRLSTA